MVFRFREPLALVLLAAPLWALYLWQKSSWVMSRTRKRLIGALRVLMLTCLVLALAGAELHTLVNSQATVYVVDSSYSARSISTEMQDWVRASLSHRRPEDSASVVVMGKQPAVDMPPTLNPFWHEVQSVVSADRTNIENALRLAAGILPGSMRRRIVLLTDGFENQGDARSLARVLAEEGIRVDVVPLNPESGKDVYVEKVSAPQRVNEGERVAMSVSLNANFAGSGRMLVYQGSSLIQDRPVEWALGRSTYVLRLLPGRQGLHAFKVVFISDQDVVPNNNEGSAVINVLGKARAAVITSRPESTANVVSALKASGVEVTRMHPADAPRDVQGWNQYNFTVLCDAAAQDFAEKSMESLEIAVRDLGRGLLMIGGEDSFGPGGYFRTAVERALPVYMDIRGRGEVPTLSLMLVIDKSGSMSETEAGISKMDLAKEAAIRATEILGEKDVVGVVAFDGEAKWVVKPQSPKALSSIQDDIGSIRAGGGTNIFPGLQIACDALREQNTKYKHIILLTDGMSAYGGNYDELLKQARDNSITLSSVAVGKDSDGALLERLARLGEGRYYFTSDTSSVPKIFTKETILASRDYFVEERFVPAVIWRSPLLSGIEAPAELAGYVATTAKETARVVLESKRGEPVLTEWQYGLGRAVAFSPDARGRFSGGWIGSGQFAQLMRNVVSLIGDPKALEGFDVSTRMQGEECTVTFTAPPDSGVSSVNMRVVAPDSAVEEVLLEPEAPGEWSGKFQALAPGAYMMSVVPQTGAGALPQISAGLAVQYSPEYRTSGSDTELLKDVAQATGGKIISDPKEAWEKNLRPVFSVRPLWSLLLAIACFALPIEVLVRKVHTSFEDWRWLHPLRGDAGKQQALGHSGGNVERLKKRRSESQRGLEGVRSRTAAPDDNALATPAGEQKSSPAHQKPPETSTVRSGINTQRLLQKKRNRDS